LSRRRRSDVSPSAEQLPLESPSLAKNGRARDANADAKIAIARRTKPSAVPGNVKLTITLDLKRALAEGLSARAIRETRNLEAVILELLEKGMR
jgi:hypothetical protein